MAATPSQYWCNHCSKYSSIESLLGAIICQDCRHRLPRFLSAASPPPNFETDDAFFRIFNNPPPSPPFQSSYDYLRLDLGGWEFNYRQHNRQIDNNQVEDDEVQTPLIENNRRRRRAELGVDDVAVTRPNRVVRWADYFPGSDYNAVEVRLQFPEPDGYFGNLGDYVDADGYEAFLRVLAERDSGGNRGSPPAGKSAVMGLETGVVSGEEEVVVCVVCRDLVNVGDLVKKLPCRHGYHGDCIVRWLEVRNSCPVCRFELPTDDPEYESERKEKLNGRTDVVVDGSSSAAPAGVGGSSGSGAVENSYDSID